MTTVSTFATIAAYLGIMVAVWTLFEKAEDAIRPKTKTAIARWLLNMDPHSAVATWPATFEAVFDSIFGQRLISWRCFFRSCITSLCLVAIVTLIWGAIRPIEFTVLFFSGVVPLRLSMFIVSFALASLIPDYISLIESRWVMRMIGGTKSWTSIGAYLLLDLILTVAIASGGLWIITQFFLSFLFWILKPRLAYGVSEQQLIDDLLCKCFFLDTIPGFLSKVLSLQYNYWMFPPPGIFFYSTFFTSIWLWVYLLAGAAVRLASYLGGGLRALRRILDFQRKPLRSVALVINVTISVLFVIRFLLSKFL